MIFSEDRNRQFPSAACLGLQAGIPDGLITDAVWEEKNDSEKYKAEIKFRKGT